jgi:hypothetical protein
MLNQECLTSCDTFENTQVVGRYELTPCVDECQRSRELIEVSAEITSPDQISLSHPNFQAFPQRSIGIRLARGATDFVETNFTIGGEVHIVPRRAGKRKADGVDAV